MMSLCEYKNLSGEPGTGIHTQRIFGFAAVDTLVTLFFGIFINHFLPNSDLRSGVSVVVFLFTLSIIVHKIFCVESTLTKKVYSL